MRRRASGSGAEDDEGSASLTKSAAGNAEKSKESLKMPFGEPQGTMKEHARRRSGDTVNGQLNPPKIGSWTKSATARQSLDKAPLDQNPEDEQNKEVMAELHKKQRARLRSPWSCSPLTFVSTAVSFLVLFVIVQSFLSRQLDPKGCAMSYMRAAFAKFSDFDTEHTRFASKYSLYLYREGGIDEDTRVPKLRGCFRAELICAGERNSCTLHPR